MIDTCNTERIASFKSKFHTVLNRVLTENDQSVEDNDPTSRVLFYYKSPVHDKTLRSYHDIDHVLDCIYILDNISEQLDISIPEYDSLFLSLVYHDAIYLVDPSSKSAGSNEKLSAELAKAELRCLGLAKGFVQEVYDLILATDHSKEIENPSKLEQIIRDIDLAGLARVWEEFDKASIAVRQEFGCIDEDSYRVGRIAFMSKLLDRDYIYMNTLLRKKMGE